MRDPVKLKEKLEGKDPSTVPQVNPCKEFLRAFLIEGPIVRTNVYRESQNQNLEWEDVKEAFHALNGREYIQRGEFFWRIYPE